MNSNAPGQLLGYSLQYPRALYHLLRFGPGDSVCVEVIGDVSITYEDGTVLTEEDKSSISANPVTNMSTDLWKTIHNWINAINTNVIDVNKTTFILYTNKAGNKALIDVFHNVTTETQAIDALKKVKRVLRNIDDKHDIWSYYDFVINKHPEIFKRLLRKFEFHVIDGGIGFKEVRLEIEKKLISKIHIDFLLENLCGWLQQELMSQISQRIPATITWETFQSKFSTIIERIHKRELIDFTLQSLPMVNELEKEKKRRPVYIQQLDAIGLSDDEVLEEVVCYLRATVNRGKWIEHEIIDEDVAQDFEKRLSQYWNSRIKSLKITEKHRNANERGQLLLYDCKARNETIRDMMPPSTTIAGTFHALADTLILGWHDDWETKFKEML